MPIPIDLTGDPAQALLQQRALDDLRAALTVLRGARSNAIVASERIPCDGDVDWLGPSSDAFRQRGLELRQQLQPALDDLEIAILTLEGEAY